MLTPITASVRFGPLSFQSPFPRSVALAWRCLIQYGKSSVIANSVTPLRSQFADLIVNSLQDGIDLLDVVFLSRNPQLAGFARQQVAAGIQIGQASGRD